MKRHKRRDKADPSGSIRVAVFLLVPSTKHTLKKKKKKKLNEDVVGVGMRSSRTAVHGNGIGIS